MADDTPAAAGDAGDPVAPDDARVDEAWRLIDAQLDGRLSADDRRRLSAMVVASPDVARLYARAVHLWCTLPAHVRRPEHPAVLLGAYASRVPDVLSETMILPALRAVDRAGDGNADADDATDGDDGTDDDDGGPAAAAAAGGRWRAAWPLWAAGGVAAVSVAAAAAVVIVGLRPVAPPSPGRPPPPAAVAVVPPPPPPTTLVPPNPGPPKPAAPTPAPSVPPVPPVPPAAVVTASAGAVWDRGAGPAPGTVLAAGEAFGLVRGGVELTFASGATAVVAAPARVRVVGRDGVDLLSGSIAAHVPPPAVGFRVASPGLSVVDRGTNFGVRTVARGGGGGPAASEVAVFDGAVDAGAGATGATAAAKPVRVTAGHAVTHPVGGTAAPVATGYAPAAFLRDVADLRLPVPTHGTGEGLAAGLPDPAWVVSVPPGGQPSSRRPAYVVFPDPGRLAANTPGAAWVSLTANMGDAALGEYRYLTTIDLTGFDPETAVVVAHFVVDDQVTDILVNGSSTAGRNPPVYGRTPKSPPRAWPLDGAPWRAGVNAVEVVVLNQDKTNGAPNPTGLQLGWTATARPTVRR